MRVIVTAILLLSCFVSTAIAQEPAGQACCGTALNSEHKAETAKPACKSQQKESVYMFSTFRYDGEDGLYLDYSYDGYSWTDLGGGFLMPKVGKRRLMRDPSIVQGPDGMFHMVWTTGWKDDKGFGYASSRDLINWSEQKFVEVMAHEPKTRNVWAPELFYDEENERYVICWASTIPGRFPKRRCAKQMVRGLTPKRSPGKRKTVLVPGPILNEFRS